MTSLTRFASIALLCFAVLSLTGVPASAGETGVGMLSYYLELVASGNYESAQSYFTPESQRRASRFGIEYIDVPMKIDCAAPLMRYPEISVSLGERPFGGETKLAFDQYTRFTFAVRHEGTLFNHNYYLLRKGDFNWLMFAQDYFSIGWDTVATKYFHIRCHPEVKKFLNPIILDEADKFVQRIAKELGLSKSDLKLLEKEKIEYFYCQSDNMVKDITGHLIKGTYDLASDDIISAFFPHNHEIIHFLVNFKLRRLPLYTLPIMREGVAVYYGGRWGKAPASLLSLGGYIYREGVAELDSLLTMTGFENSAASDLAYPLAGMFTAYIIDAKGADGFLDIYRQMSGKFDSLFALTPMDIKAAFITALGKSSWDELRADFESFVGRWVETNSGIYPGAASGKAIFEIDGITIIESKEWLTVSATSVDSDPPIANLLFARDKDIARLNSSLFDTQYRTDSALQGYRFGIRFDRYEVGLYDYATNELVAKYIWGITPSDEYYNEAANTVQFRIRRDLIGSKPPRKDDYLLLEN